jgi:predicted nucleic acid-binding protein
MPWRAGRVAAWLESATTPPDPKADDLVLRTSELMGLGFRNFDALHVACAELAGADVFATTDDRLLRLAVRHGTVLRVRITDVVTLAREVLT